jgi:hypothetical protein
MQKLGKFAPNLNLQNNPHWSSTYIYKRLTNANISYLKSKNGRKCVTCVNFSHMQKFLSQMSNINNTLNVLLTPHVSNIELHFN